MLFPVASMRRLDLWTRYYIRWNPTMQPQVCDTSACMHVNLLKSSILKAVVGFCLVLQESEEQRSRELHFLCEQVPKECPSTGRNFMPFSAIGKCIFRRLFSSTV